MESFQIQLLSLLFLSVVVQQLLESGDITIHLTSATLVKTPLYNNKKNRQGKVHVIKTPINLDKTDTK